MHHLLRGGAFRIVRLDVHRRGKVDASRQIGRSNWVDEPESESLPGLMALLLAQFLQAQVRVGLEGELLLPEKTEVPLACGEALFQLHRVGCSPSQGGLRLENEHGGAIALDPPVALHLLCTRMAQRGPGGRFWPPSS